MKTFKSSFILILVATLIANGAVFAGVSDKTEDRKVGHFNAIKVSTGIDLFITMGEQQTVKIIAADDIIDEIVSEVKDGTLQIYLKRSNWFNWGANKSRKAYVTVTELNKIDASSGSDVKSENTLKGETLIVEASSGSDVNLDLVYKSITIDTSSGSDAKIRGKAKTLVAEASSGSDIMARDLETVICHVKASSGSDVTVNVSTELSAKASSGSDIRYYGNPGSKDIDESSGGNVTRK